MADDPGEFLSPRTAGRLLGVSAETVRRMALAGVFDHAQIRKTLGGHRRIARREVERVAAEMTEPAAE